MAKENGYTELYRGMDLDWSLPVAPTVDAQGLGFAIKGLFFKKDEGEIEPPVEAPDMPVHDLSSPAEFQAFISNYLLDSLGSTFLQVHTFDYWTYSKLVPDSFPIKMTTSGLDEFFPGLEAHYGKDLPVDAQYILERVGDFNSRENDQTMGFSGTVGVKFWVETDPQDETKRDLAVHITADRLAFLFNLMINGNLLSMNIRSVKLADIKVESTTFGNLDL